MKKYELTNETIIFKGVVLHRIKALKDFGDVKSGELGGYIQNEKNLSQIGECWVYDNAKVYEDAYVSGWAKICDNAILCGGAAICDGAKIFENAIISGCSRVSDEATVHGNALVGGYTLIFEDAEICDYAIVSGTSCVHGEAKVCGNAKLVENENIGSGKVIVTKLSNDEVKEETKSVEVTTKKYPKIVKSEAMEMRYYLINSLEVINSLVEKDIQSGYFEQTEREMLLAYRLLSELQTFENACYYWTDYCDEDNEPDTPLYTMTNLYLSEWHFKKVYSKRFAEAIADMC